MSNLTNNPYLLAIELLDARTYIRRDEELIAQLMALSVLFGISKYFGDSDVNPKPFEKFTTSFLTRALRFIASIFYFFYSFHFVVHFYDCQMETVSHS